MSAQEATDRLFGRLRTLAATQVLEVASKTGEATAYGVSTTRARAVLAESAICSLDVVDVHADGEDCELLSEEKKTKGNWQP